MTAIKTDRNYLSWLYVTVKLLATYEIPSGKREDKLPLMHGVASDRVYICKYVTILPVSSYLAFPSLPGKARRFISVALSRRSPSADVISYPAL